MTDKFRNDSVARTSEGNRIDCPTCQATLIYGSEAGGRMGRCGVCGARFILPIPDAKELLAWAESAPWRRLRRFIRLSGARGHNRLTIEALVRIAERRRWDAENREHYEIANSQAKCVRTDRERRQRKVDRAVDRVALLDLLRRLSPAEFEEFVVKLFRKQGLDARAVGGSSDNGIDVKIFGEDGNLFAIAQCKRFGVQSRVRAQDVRNFGGAYLLSDVEKGFIVTTGRLTRSARRTAGKYSWLTVIEAKRLVRLCEDLSIHPNDPSHI